MKAPKTSVAGPGSPSPAPTGVPPGKTSRLHQRYGSQSKQPAGEAAKGGTDSKARIAGPEAPAAGPADESAALLAQDPTQSADGEVIGPDTGADAAASDGAAASARDSKAEAVRAVGAVTHGSVHAGGPKEAKDQAVKPTDGSTFNGAAGANNCLPGDVTGASVTWDVVAGATTWGVNITGFTTTGAINVAPWPSKPTSMVTPNTANPVDGGNIKNKAGDNNDYRFAIKEMKEYHMASGGRSSYWHSYAASKAHEQKHWDLDWLVTCIGAWWPTYNTKLDAITIPKASAADAAAARLQLQTKVNALCKELDGKLTTAWNAVPDSPGLAGSNGYDAGQKVLDGLITKVEAYAKSKGWP